jgi:two-component sensor histidine kinase
VEPPPWLSWWAYSIYALATLLAAYAARRVYDTYMMKEQALRYAEEMQITADRIADDLQDQVEFQAKLADSIHFYQRDVIIWAQRCEELTRQYACDAADQSNRMGKRLHALELLQDSLYYQGERLYANLKVFTDQLFDYLAGLRHEQGQRFTLINELADELTPASHAIALAVALAELVDNSLEHAFSASCPACYIRVVLQVENVPEMRSDRLTLTYQDDGVGVPEALSLDTPDSAGFAIIAASAQSVGGDISFLDQERKGILLQFTVPWVRELGTSQAPERD